MTNRKKILEILPLKISSETICNILFTRIFLKTLIDFFFDRKLKNHLEIRKMYYGLNQNMLIKENQNVFTTFLVELFSIEY